MSMTEEQINQAEIVIYSSDKKYIENYEKGSEKFREIMRHIALMNSEKCEEMKKSLSEEIKKRGK